MRHTQRSHGRIPFLGGAQPSKETALQRAREQARPPDTAVHGFDALVSGYLHHAQYTGVGLGSTGQKPHPEAVSGERA